MNIRWFALHDAAGVVATLAGVPACRFDAAERTFPATMRDANNWRRDLAEQGITDLCAIMEAGIAALLNLHARGSGAQAPARALWEEFTTARAALLALAPAEAA